jgi:hypothetical protein
MKISKSDHHYLAYHSEKVMGYKYTHITNERFCFLTEKPLRFVENMRKGVVWVICGIEDSKGILRYYLSALFRVASVEEYKSDPDEFDGKFQPSLAVVGREGVFFKPKQLTGVEWFEEYYVQKHRYSLGIFEIMSNPVIKSLFDIIKTQKGLEIS